MEVVMTKHRFYDEDVDRVIEYTVDKNFREIQLKDGADCLILSALDVVALAEEFGYTVARL